jgi:hypothetical protein
MSVLLWKVEILWVRTRNDDAPVQQEGELHHTRSEGEDRVVDYWCEVGFAGIGKPG